MADFVWVSVMDKTTCESCEKLNGQVKSMETWIQEGTPGVRDTICNGNCRCDLIPADWTEGRIQQEIQKAIDEGVEELAEKLSEGIRIDVKNGKIVREPIQLKQYSDIKGITTEPLEKIADLEIGKIEWKRKNAFKDFPEEFYKIDNIQGQIDWLGRNT